MERVMSKLNDLEKLEALMAKASPAPWRGSCDYKPLSKADADPFYVGNGCGQQHSPVKKSNQEQMRKMMDRIEF